MAESKRDFVDWVRLADAHTQSRSYAEAMEAYACASRLHPASPSVLAALGDLHALLGDDGAALERYLDSHGLDANAKAREGAAQILARYAAPRPLAGDASSQDAEILAQVFHGAATSGSGWVRSDRSTLQELVAEYLMGPAARPPSPVPPSAGEAARRAVTYAWAMYRLGVPRITLQAAYHPLDAHLPFYLTLRSYLAGVEPSNSSTAPARAVSLLMSFPEEFEGIAAGLWGYPNGLCFDTSGHLDAMATLDQGAGDAAADSYLFDRDFYSQRYQAGDGGGASPRLDPYLEYLLDGASKWRRPHRLFNSRYYAEKIGARRGQHLFANYLCEGGDRISPTPLFDTEFYLAMHPDVAAAVRNGEFTDGLHHFVLYGASEGKSPSSDWDPDYYIESYADIRGSLDFSSRPRANATAFEHFMRFGLAEGRAPSEFFDCKYYVNTYPEVEDEIRAYDLLGPFEHFAWIGRKKGYRCREPLHSVKVPELHAKSLYMKRCQANAFDLQNGRTITLLPAADPFFSVIVPCKDNFPFTARVLKLLRDAIGYAAAEGGFGVEVILVDDASSDATKDAPRLVAGLRYVRLEQSGGYPVACNAGAAVARGKFLIFMNNDLEFEADLLAELRTIIDRDADEVACFGVTVTLMTGVIQDAGSSVWADGAVRGHDRGAPVWRHDLQSPREVDFVAGCFLCISRAEFEDLGGFSEIYAPGYFEDVDLCARVWESGRKVRVYPALRIAHFESGSFNAGKGRMAAASLMTRNRDRFVEENSGFARQKLPFSEHGRRYSRLLNTGRPRCLFIEDFVPDRTRGSGYGRAENILRQMTLVADVRLFAAHRTRGPLPDYSEWFSVQYGPDPQVLARCLATEQFDCVYICRPHNMQRYAEVLADWKGNFGGSVIYDAEAIFSVREFVERTAVESYAAMNGDPLFESMVREELNCVGEVADVVVTVNELEGAIAARVTGRRVVTIGHSCESRTSPPPGLLSRAGLLFVGAFQTLGAPNFDAVRWFSEKVMPKIVEQRPDTVLNIVGYLSEGLDLSQFTGPNVIYHGHARDLRPFYDMARVFVAPSRIGAGIPIKVIEAVSNGLPCVASALLSEQLQVGGRPETSVLSATTLDDGVEFASNCLRLLNDDSLWLEMQAATFASAQSYDRQLSLTSELEQLLKAA